jgi:hypothetical protein
MSVRQFENHTQASVIIERSQKRDNFTNVVDHMVSSNYVALWCGVRHRRPISFNGLNVQGSASCVGAKHRQHFCLMINTNHVRSWWGNGECGDATAAANIYYGAIFRQGLARSLVRRTGVNYFGHIK